MLKDWDGEVIRLALLKAHYRSELVWTEDLLKESKAQLDGWYRNLQLLDDLKSFEVKRELKEERFSDLFSTLTNDLDGIMFLFKMSALQTDISGNLFGRYSHTIDVSDSTRASDAKSMIESFELAANLLGLLQKDPEAWFKGGASADEEAEFDAIALRRQEARAAKDWAAADAARDEATAKGIVLEDGPDGTTWRKA